MRQFKEQIDDNLPSQIRDQANILENSLSEKASNILHKALRDGDGTGVKITNSLLSEQLISGSNQSYCIGANANANADANANANKNAFSPNDDSSPREGSSTSAEV
jgi:hypothetical protein